MKRLIKWLMLIAVLVGGGIAASHYGGRYWKERNRVVWRQAEVTRGRVVSVVNSTGTVKPVLSVSVGAFVSGPIETLHVKHNDEVKKGDLLAEIDPRIYDASVARDRAILATRKAEVERAKAQLQQARNDEGRAVALRAENKGFLSDTEMDQFKFNRVALEAMLTVADANVLQAQANLENSEANLGYTKIRAPVDGIIIDRKIDPGQTLATQFQTPVLFVVAPDMRKEMHIFASVDEADIAQIREAQKREQPVQFTVDSMPEELFVGKVEQIRMSSTTTQNVVTYPVVVSVANPDLKLWPDMTASISFQVAERKDVMRIPNAALRFYPQRDKVRAEDRKLLDSAGSTPEQEKEKSETNVAAEERAEARRRRNRRHVWVVDGEFLRAVEVVIGLSDSKHTELVSGDLKEGDQLVTGIQPRE